MDLIADDYLQHTGHPLDNDRVLFAGEGDVIAAPDPDRSAYDGYDEPGDEGWDWTVGQ